MTRAANNVGPPVEPLPGIIGSSRAMTEVYRLTRQVARSRASVLLLGETGTGKELLAHAIHTASPRAHKPLVSLNIAAVPETASTKAMTSTGT